MKTKLQKQAEVKLKKLKSLLSKASQGKMLNGEGSDIFLDDAAELVKYYSCISKGKIEEAYLIQSDVMDTATADLIEVDMYEAVYDEANR